MHIPLTRIFPARGALLTTTLTLTAMMLGIPSGASAVSVSSKLIDPAATTIHVDAGSGATAPACGRTIDPCATLADAARVADLNDVIEVDAGSYAGATFTTNVTLRGTSLPRVTGTIELPAAGSITGLEFVANGTDPGLRLTSGGGVAEVRGASFNGFGAAPAIVVMPGVTGTVTVHGVRIARGSGVLIDNQSSGSVDARGVWWGSNAGAAAGALHGAIDVRDPLQLAGPDAPNVVLAGGSGVVTARVVDASGTTMPLASGWIASAATTAAALDDSMPRVRAGVIGVLITASTVPGSVTTTITLDDEQVAATTRVATADSFHPSPLPTEAAAMPAPRYFARIRIVRYWLSRALTRGISQVITTNRPASVHAKLFVSHYDARRLGLRAADATTHEPFVVGSARTRAIGGTRTVTVRLSDRARYAIARSGRRLAVIVHTRVISRGGSTRATAYRIALAGDVR